ncbi:methyl-accepting chemotaxis protein [Posidoniimonas corsicana]|nr:methyl-accepting chemotaxis protein [Posidoniimonas corsicana]
MATNLLMKRKAGRPEPVAAAPNSDSQAVLDAFSLSQAIIEFQPDGTIVTANDNFLAVLGYSLSEIQGQHHRMFVEPGEAQTDAYQQFWRDLAEGRPNAGQFKRFAKDGSEIWISASYNPVFDEAGKVAKIVKIAGDITELKLAGEEARRLANMIRLMPFNIMYADAGNVIRYMNPASERGLKVVEDLLPMSVDQVVGSSIDAFHKDPSHQQRLLADESKLPISTQIKLGEYVFELMAVAISDEQGARLGSMAAWRDITEQVRTREEAASIGQTVAASATEMAATIEEISKSVGRTASLASNTEDHVRDSSAAAQMLQESSKAIDKVVGVIQELADQTNLLALNATIEAARAGESGRSFAVVANEVKELAQETGAATQSIEKSVEEMRQRIEQVTLSTRQITESIAEVSGNTSTVAAAIEEQSITMGELSKNAEGLVKLADRANA